MPYSTPMPPDPYPSTPPFHPKGSVEAYRRVGGDARAQQHTDALCVQALAWSAGASAAAAAGRHLVDAFVRRAVAGSLAGLEAPSGEHRVTARECRPQPAAACTTGWPVDLSKR